MRNPSMKLIVNVIVKVRKCDEWFSQGHIMWINEWVGSASRRRESLVSYA